MWLYFDLIKVTKSGIYVGIWVTISKQCVDFEPALVFRKFVHWSEPLAGLQFQRIVLQQKIINAYGCDAGFIPYNRTFFSDNDDLLE